jgi:hypothetical protein
MSTVTEELDLKEKAAHVTDGFYRRMRASADTTRYVMAGMGALVLVLINLVGTLLSSDRGLFPDEAIAIFAACCVASLCIVSGFGRLYLQGSAEDEAIRFEVATKIGDGKQFTHSKRYFESQILKTARATLRIMLMVTGASAVLVALWAFYLVVF